MKTQWSGSFITLDLLWSQSGRLTPSQRTKQEFTTRKIARKLIWIMRLPSSATAQIQILEIFGGSEIHGAKDGESKVREKFFLLNYWLKILSTGYGKFARNRNNTCGICNYAMFPCHTYVEVFWMSYVKWINAQSNIEYIFFILTNNSCIDKFYIRVDHTRLSMKLLLIWIYDIHIKN